MKDNNTGRVKESSTSVKNSRGVTIYHAEGKNVLYFLGMMAIAMSIAFGFAFYNMTVIKNEADVNSAKIAGIVLGLSEIK